jgi:tripeptidyl-peptidase-1
LSVSAYPEVDIMHSPHVTIFLLPALCSAALVGMESPTMLPDGWTVGGPADRDASIELTFAVRQQGLQELHNTLMRVSDPRSTSYGEHLSNEEVHDLTAPKPEHLATVIDFLKRHGVEGKRATPNGDLITATVSFAAAEKMLSTRYVQLTHSTGASVKRALSGYSLPAEVAAAIDFVSPTGHIPGVGQPIRTVRSSKDNGTISNNQPKSLRQLYSIGSAVGKAAGNKQAVTAFLKQFYSASDLQDFWKQYCDGIECGKGLPTLVGDATTGSPGVESMLDIEYITGVGGAIDTEFWGFSGTSPDNKENEPFMKWLAKVSSTSDADIPKLFSTSYGEAESSWSPAAATRLNAEFMKAGARGISLLYASGDSGASCKSGKFTPNMPASSPYVTAVGGTAPASGFPSPTSEEAIGLSSGGFSNYWATPEWQKEAVAAYLKQPGVPSSSERGYNTSGRGFPDIAAQATDFCVTPFGCGVAGTSCASPTAAGVIGLLNDLRLQNGKATLGFLNPFLYQNADSLFDVTEGSSTGCGFLSKGWPAMKGWDAVTGLGTPNYEKLAKAVSALPGPAPVWQRKASTVVV